MEKEILKLIRESLPEKTAGELKKYIESAEALKEYTTNLEDEKDRLNKAYTKLVKSEADFNTAASLLKEANEKLEKVYEKERDLKIIELEIRLESAEYVKNNFQLFLSNMGKNHELMKSFFANVNVSGNGPGGEYVNLNGSISGNQSKSGG